MFGTHFYHEHIKRAVAVFGTLFNNIKVVKKDSTGKALSTIKVPLAYGPKQKFLARILDEKYLNDPKLAIRLPRMSFELISITYDQSTKLQKGMTRTVSSGPTSKSTVLYPVGYRLGIQLNVLAKNQDDALQILEQILPFFQPDYTVTVKELNGTWKNDMPFVLESVSMADDYEGDFNSRRAIIYTLDFETRVRFYGPIQDRSIIRQTESNFATGGAIPSYSQVLTVSPLNAGPDDDYTINVSFNEPIPDSGVLTLTGITSGPYVVGETVYGVTSGTVGIVSAVSGDTITVIRLDGVFTAGEQIVGETSNASGALSSAEYTIDPNINIIPDEQRPTLKYDII
jgi:hypothetical protein